MLYRLRNVTYAVWEYLNQPLCCLEAEDSVWKPSRFWYLYKIKFLEACWLREYYMSTDKSIGHDEFRAGN